MGLAEITRDHRRHLSLSGKSFQLLAEAVATTDTEHRLLADHVASRVHN